MSWIYDGTGAVAVWTMDPSLGAATALDVRCAVSLPDWTPDRPMTLVSQSYLELDTGGGAEGAGLFAFGIDGSGALPQLLDGTGTLWVYLPKVGTLSPYTYGSGTAVPASANDVYCLRVTFSDSANEVKFFYKASTAGSAEADMIADTGWTQLGSTDTHSQSLAASTNPVVLGYDPWEGGYDFNGTFYGASVATAIDGDPVIQALSSEAGTATTWPSSTGERWYTNDHPLPILTADISTNSDPWTDATWVNLDGYIRAVSTNRQATLRQPGSVSAGTATITVDNRDRTFDPAYTAGSFGTWTPGRRIRLRVVKAGTMYGLIEGYIGNIRQTYEAGSPRYSEAEIDIIDGWGDLQQRTIIDDDWSYGVIEALSPTMWWRMGDNGPQIATVGTSFGGSSTPLPVAGIGPGLPASASSFNGHDLNLRADFTDSSTQSLSLWFRTSSAADTGLQRVIWTSQGASDGVTWGGVISVLSITDAGNLYLETTTPTGTAATAATSTTVVTDGLTHHLAVVSGPSTTSVWLDNVPIISAATGVGRLCFDDAALIIGAVGSVPSGQAFIGVISDVAFWSGYALTAANRAAILAAGNGHDGDNTGTRVARVLDAVGWPAGWRTIATGKAMIGSQACNTNAADMLRVAAAGEYGLIFIDKDGWVRFRNRLWHIEETTGSTSQATFSDDGAGIEYRAGGIDWDVEQWHLNDVTVTGSYGSIGREIDTTYPLKRAATISTTLRTSTDCKTLAGKIMRHRFGALSSLRPWTCSPQGDDWASVLSLELGDRITFELTPQDVGSQIVEQLAVSAIRHDISEAGLRWTVTFAGDPIDPSNYFILGTSTLGAAGGYVLG